MDGASSSGVAGPFSFPRPREPPSFSISSRTSSLPRLPGLLFPRAFATCWSLHCGWRIVLSITTTSSSHVVYVVVDSSISCGFDWNLERETVGDETRNRPVRSPIPLRFRRGVVWRQARAAHPRRSSPSHVRVAEARRDGEPVQQDQRRGATDGVDGAGPDHGGRWDVAGGEHGQRIRPLPSDGPSQARKGEGGKGMKRGREEKRRGETKPTSPGDLDEPASHARENPTDVHVSRAAIRSWSRYKQHKGKNAFQQAKTI